MKNKLFALLFCLLVVFVFCSAEAADRDWDYKELDDGTVEITDYKGSEYEKEIVVPDTLRGKTVTGISSMAFSDLKNAISISIPDSIVSIEGNPFKYCENLEEIKVSPDSLSFALIDGVLFNKKEKSLVAYPITLPADYYEVPNGIKKIGKDAFGNSMNLTSVTLPDTVKEIGDYSFSKCNA